MGALARFSALKNIGCHAASLLGLQLQASNMVHSPIEATVFYSHTEEEILELAEAIRPIFDHIRAVGSDVERARLRTILSCNHFRAHDVGIVIGLLLRAAKHARNHLAEYFPSMQEAIIAQAENLEDAVQRYSKRFVALQNETIPAN